MGGKSGGSQTVQQKSDPWKGIQPYLIGSQTRQLKPGVKPIYTGGAKPDYETWKAQNPNGSLTDWTQLPETGNQTLANPDSDYEIVGSPGLYQNAQNLYNQSGWNSNQAGEANNFYNTLISRQNQFNNYDTLAGQLINGQFDARFNPVSNISGVGGYNYNPVSASLMNAPQSVSYNPYQAYRSDTQGYSADKSSFQGYTADQADSRGYDAQYADSKGYNASLANARGYNAQNANATGYNSTDADYRGYSGQGYDAALAGRAQGYGTRDAEAYGYDPSKASATGYNAANIAGVGPINSQNADPSSVLSSMGLNPSIQKLLSGKVDTAALDPVIANANRRMDENFNENVMSGIRSNAAAAGQVGSSRQGIAEGLAARGLEYAKGDMAANMYNQAYQQAQNNMLSASSLLSNLGFTNAGQNADRNLAAQTTNANNSLNTQQYNANANNAAGQFGATANNAVSLANAGYENAAGAAYSGNRTNTSLANANATNAANQFGANAGNQFSLADQNSINAARQFGAGANNTANQFSAGAYNNNSALNANNRTAASQFGAGAQNAASLANAGYGNTAMQFGANADNQASLSNAGWLNNASQFGSGAYNAASLANAGYGNTAGQFGANAYNNAALQNAGWLNNASQFGANAYNNNSQFNANSENTARQFGAGAFNNAALQYGANQTDANKTNANMGYNSMQQNVLNNMNYGQFNANALNNMGQFNAGLNKEFQFGDAANTLNAQQFNANLGLSNNNQLMQNANNIINNRTTGLGYLGMGNQLIDSIYGQKQGLLGAGNNWNWNQLQNYSGILSPGLGVGGTSSSTTSDNPSALQTIGNIGTTAASIYAMISM